MKKIPYFLLLVSLASFVVAQTNKTVSPTAVKGIFAAFGLMWVVVILLFIVAFALSIAAMVFWIFMLVDCAKRDFKNESDKVVWILVIALLNWIGALIYYIVVKRQDKK